MPQEMNPASKILIPFLINLNLVSSSISLKADLDLYPLILFNFLMDSTNYQDRH